MSAPCSGWETAGIPEFVPAFFVHLPGFCPSPYRHNPIKFIGRSTGKKQPGGLLKGSLCKKIAGNMHLSPERPNGHQKY
jgi:hypothetical protein